MFTVSQALYQQRHIISDLTLPTALWDLSWTCFVGEKAEA